MINTIPLEICAVLVSVALYLAMYAKAIVNNTIDIVEDDDADC